MNDKVKTTIKENKFLFASIVVIVLVIILIVFGYKKGYRFQENFMLGQVGTLSLEIPLPQTNVFINDNQKIVTTKDNEIVKVSLSPTKQTIIVSRDGYYPWKKDFSMPSKGNISFNPVFVSSNPSGIIITQKDPEFWKIRNKIITDALPSKDAPRISKDGSAKLWIEDNAIKVEVAPSKNSGQATTTTTSQTITVIGHLP